MSSGTRARRPRARLALGIAVALLTVAAAVPGPVGASTRTGASAAGTVRIAAEQEPDCADWIASCAGLAWGNWILGIQTLPQAFRVDADGEYVPGPVLVDEPTLDPGPPMRVTYRIRPEAVWSDGQPITSEDFAYLWKQVTTGKDIYDTTGYSSITSVDTTDPKVAVVTFKEPYAAWRDLFGGFYFLLPSHLLEGRNRHKVMKDGYAFSGGPWMLEGGASGWRKGQSITLVPNPRYWGEKPRLAKVIFQFVPETAAEVQAVKTGQVLAAYPQPQTGILDEFDQKPNLRYTVGFGNTFEGIWLNAEAFPLDSRAVRQALLYATDRDAIVDQIVDPATRNGQVLQSFVVPTFRDYYTPSFARYTHDLAKVDELMTADGWRRGSDGIWRKDGRRAAFSITTTAGNEARELTEQIWQSQLEQAGFVLKIRNASADTLFGRLAPRGRFAAALYAQVGTPDPGLCVVFCSANIPTKENGYVGQNWTRLVSGAIDQPWTLADAQLDPLARAQTVRQGQAALAEEAVSIPLYQLPTLFVWDASKLGGPLRDNTVEGPFANLNEWVLK